jgi:hypothetical protein
MMQHLPRGRRLGNHADSSAANTGQTGVPDAFAEALHKALTD